MKSKIKKNIYYGRQTISGDDVDAVISVLNSDFLTQGPCVPKFQENVNRRVDVEFACATNSATSALHISCLALGVGSGDTVWTSPNSFVASSNAALYCGASVDFVDIDPLTLNICVDSLQEKLHAAKLTNSLPKVIIPVHFAGLPCDMESIFRLSREYGFRIIEDASHALGASYSVEKLDNTISVGSCRHSDITVFSFHPVKMITTGEGGMALTNDPTLFQRLNFFRSHGITSEKSMFDERPENEIWNYQQIDLGFNYRMTDIHAALGISQLTKLDFFLNRRREIAENYNKAFESLPVYGQDHSENSSYHLYVINLSDLSQNKNQKKLFEHLHSNSVGANLHYIPIYLQPFYRKLGFKPGYCPNAEDYFRRCVSLPIFPSLSKCEFDHVVETIKDFF